MEKPGAAIDYVVVHELAHLKHKNHGPGFYACVAGVLPDYRERRKLLKEGAVMKLLIDADGCPVVDEAVSISQEFGIECLILCDTSIGMKGPGKNGGCFQRGGQCGLCFGQHDWPGGCRRDTGLWACRHVSGAKGVSNQSGRS